MTLLVNEIHVLDDLKNSFILQIADRRITRSGIFTANQKKIFKIPYLNACVGFFGLAEINSKTYMSNWLSTWISNNSKFNTIEQFSTQLCIKLNEVVDKSILPLGPSGFQICGYNLNGFPEMWFIKNFDRMEGNKYIGFNNQNIVNEEFLHDTAVEKGFDGSNLKVNGSFICYYINGDVRPFHQIWRQLDSFIEAMLSETGFTKISDKKNLEKIAKWKMTVISTFYKNFAKKILIGNLSDVFLLVPEDEQNKLHMY